MPDPTVAAYLRDLPEHHRAACRKLRRTIKANLPEGFREEIFAGMPSWVVPVASDPAEDDCESSIPLPFVSFEARGSSIGLHHMGLHADPDLMAWWTAEWPRHVETKLVMRRGFIRFPRPEAIPFELVGELCTRMTPQEFVHLCELAMRP